MKSKNDVMSVAQQSINTYVKPLRAAYPDMGMIFVHTDNGEFNSKENHDYLLVRGVYSMLTCPCTPQHNAVIEAFGELLLKRPQLYYFSYIA